MAEIEKLEMDAQRDQLVADLRLLIEKYRAIFDWDVPDVDETMADKLIIKVLRQALDDIAVGKPKGTPC